VTERRKIELNIDALAITLVETMAGQKCPDSIGHKEALDTMGPDGEVARKMARMACDFFKKAMAEAIPVQ